LSRLILAQCHPQELGGAIAVQFSQECLNDGIAARFRLLKLDRAGGFYLICAARANQGV